MLAGLPPISHIFSGRKNASFGVAPMKANLPKRSGSTGRKYL
jgi:hypothetical protein